MTSKVQLYVYDLSRGMAAQLAPAFGVDNIEGIWHTSVVVFDMEYFYGQGIMTSRPGMTQYGPPLRIIDMGYTELSNQVIKDYIENLKSVYTAEKYHLMGHVAGGYNCNNFSNDVCSFLVGKSIPSYILSLPADFLRTPLGQSLLPMINGMFTNSTEDISSSNLETEAASMLSMAAQQTITSKSTSNEGTVQIATTLSTFNQIISSHPTIAMFTNPATCPPCRMIHPEFKRIATTIGQKITFVEVNTGIGFEVAQKFNISSIPTFITFYKGKQLEQFSGANVSQLQSAIKFLEFTAYPPHPHTKLDLKTLNMIGTKPILYSSIGNVEAIFRKLDEFIKEDILETKEQEQISFEFVKSYIIERSKGEISPNLPDLLQWSSKSLNAIEKLKPEHVFAILDILRIGLVDTRIGSYFISDLKNTISEILLWTSLLKNPPRNVLLISLRLGCNLFATNLLSSHILNSFESRTQLTHLLISTLLNQDKGIQQAAAGLAFNLSSFIANGRKIATKGETEESLILHDDLDWLIEIISAIIESMSDLCKKDLISNQDTLHRLIASLGWIIYLIPEKEGRLGEIQNLLNVLDISLILEKIQSTVNKQDIKLLCKEVKELIA